MTIPNIEKSEENENKELIVIFKQDGTFELDFQVSKENFSEDQIEIQQEIHNRYIKCENQGMFFIGFLEKTQGLTESVSYLRFIIATFIKKLSMNPDIELLRENTLVDLDKAVTNDLLGNAPYLTGLENLNALWIEKLWHKLNNSFSEMIVVYKGSVSEFFKS
ncbi:MULTISPECIES: hypothetical protein [Clostridium]|uniref:Uncharacterized protein n=1 Tax=Clostridium frigoriphilum TaxID=443253 RepID=A0ABU7UUN7_9CLOT|nr:hypothetical protein [Clostridium sp. DSM 17811]MBU3101999.1 hypothetical protein [Clostridium sp. DSM 17811]